MINSGGDKNAEYKKGRKNGRGNELVQKKRLKVDKDNKLTEKVYVRRYEKEGAVEEKVMLNDMKYKIKDSDFGTY